MSNQFTCQSTATPLEKARRTLQHLADKRDGAYFYDDGYPREAIHTDAAATLAVLTDMAAGIERLRLAFIVNGLRQFTDKSRDELSAEADRIIGGAAATAAQPVSEAIAATEAAHAAEASIVRPTAAQPEPTVMQYLALTDAMHYEAGPQLLSAEEYAAALYADAMKWRAAAAAAQPQPDTARMDLLSRPGIETGMDDDEDEPFVVYRVSGGRNDREWSAIGRGATMRDAADAAAKKLAVPAAGATGAAS